MPRAQGLVVEIVLVRRVVGALKELTMLALVVAVVVIYVYVL
jgi:hypothetical protein